MCVCVCVLVVVGRGGAKVVDRTRVHTGPGCIQPDQLLQAFVYQW